MKKRMVAIGMCLALSMGMLAGCGSSEKSAETSETVTESTTDVVEDVKSDQTQESEAEIDENDPLPDGWVSCHYYLPNNYYLQK